MTALNPAVSRYIPFFFLTPPVVVTITSPTSGQVIGTATPTITWTLPVGKIQASYIVNIYSDASASTLVYSSGIVASATQSHTVAAGSLLSGESYWVFVAITDTIGEAGESAIVDFTTLFLTSVPVSGLTVKARDACFDASDVPYTYLHWTQVVPGAGETFTEYLVLRRVGGDTTWTLLAEITDITTTHYEDWLASPYTVYEYAVLWQATSASGILQSAQQTPVPWAQLRFDYTWLQRVDDHTLAIMLKSWDQTVDQVQDVTLATTAGRTRPTAFVGEPLYHSTKIPADVRLARESHWPTVLAFVEAQANEAAVYCLRIGKQRLRYFGVITDVSRAGQQLTYGVGLTFVETHYEECL